MIPEPPCGACRRCRLIAADAHPEVRVVGVQPPHRVIRVADVESIQADAALRAADVYRKVYVLEQAELLHPDAANRLLKTIEEPPSSVVMILTTVDPEATLETIVSRCQHLRLRPLRRDRLAQHLVETSGLAPERADLLAALAEGCVGRALTPGGRRPGPGAARAAPGRASRPAGRRPRRAAPVRPDPRRPLEQGPGRRPRGAGHLAALVARRPAAPGRPRRSGRQPGSPTGAWSGWPARSPRARPAPPSAASATSSRCSIRTSTRAWRSTWRRSTCRARIERRELRRVVARLRVGIRPAHLEVQRVWPILWALPGKLVRPGPWRPRLGARAVS